MAKKIKKTDKRGALKTAAYPIKKGAAGKEKRGLRQYSTAKGKKKVQPKKATTVLPAATESQINQGTDHPASTHEQPQQTQQQQGTTTQAPPPPAQESKPYERVPPVYSKENIYYSAEYLKHIEKMNAEKKVLENPIPSRFGGWTISPIAPSLWMLAGAGYGALDHLSKNKGYETIDRRRLKLEMLLGMLWGFMLGILFGVKIEYFPSGCNSCGNRMISIPEYLWIRLMGDSSKKEAAKKMTERQQREQIIKDGIIQNQKNVINTKKA